MPDFVLAFYHVTSEVQWLLLYSGKGQTPLPSPQPEPCQGEVEKLRAKIASLESSQVASQAKVASADAQLEKLQEQVAFADSELVRLRAKVSFYETESINVKDYQQEVHSLRAKLVWYENMRDWVSGLAYEVCSNTPVLPEWLQIHGKKVRISPSGGYEWYD